MNSKLFSTIQTLFNQIISAVSGTSAGNAVAEDQNLQNYQLNKVRAGQIAFFFYDSKNIVL